MSILLDPPTLTRRTTGGKSALWFSMYVAAVLIGGACLGGLLIGRGLEQGEGFWFRLIDTHGSSRVLRRIQTLLAVALAPWMLRAVGWPGIRDMGWNSDQSREERKLDFFRWFGIGLLVMGAVFAVSFATGVRQWEGLPWWPSTRVLIRSFLITGIGVGFIEETMARGVLYKSLARAWTPWTAAVVSSLLFSWAHFMKATPESFIEGPGAVVLSSLFAEFAIPVVPLKFINLFAFGMVLSRLVQHRGDIWAATGLHAAAVGCIRWFGAHTEFNTDTPYQPWIGGHSSKFDDGWLLTFCLLLILLAIEWRQRNPGSSRVRF